MSREGELKDISPEEGFRVRWEGAGRGWPLLVEGCSLNVMVMFAWERRRRHYGEWGERMTLNL